MIKEENTKKEIVIKVLLYILGLFIATFIYNIIFVPNNIVTGGVSGLAVVIKAITGLSTTIFIDVTNVILVIIGFILLDKKEALRQAIGCVAYPLMITITSPLAKVVHFELNNTLLLIILATMAYGFANGVIYRAGFSTGGSDIIIKILSNRVKRPITAISPILNTIIIILGGLVFSPVKVIYAITVIFISNRIANAILLSISTSKMVYIISSKNDDVSTYLLNKLHIGITEIKINKRIPNRKKVLLMCIVHNAKYNSFKTNILSIDPKATIITKKCYGVTGGKRYNILPF